MKKILKTLKALGLIILNPWKLNLILNQNEQWEKYILKKHKIKGLPVLSFNYFIKEPIVVSPFAFLDGGSLPTDIALLKQLAANIPNCRYFEIGTWRGESVTNVADAADICYSLNLPDNELYKLTNSEDYVKSHRLFSKNRKNIRHIYGNSRNYNYSGLNMNFDLIFIDGDHHYEAIYEDTKNMLDFLCHDNTVIVWHDYAYNPESIRYETLAAILDACPKELHHFLYHVKNTNCALLYRQALPSGRFKKYAIPDYCFSINIKISPL